MRNKQKSRERKSGWGLIAAIFKSIDKDLFKVDQRSLRDPLSKLLSEEPEDTELHVLLEEVA